MSTSAVTLHAADGQAFTLRHLDELVAQATAAGLSWDSIIYVRGTRMVNPLKAPGVPFNTISAAPDWRTQ